MRPPEDFDIRRHLQTRFPEFFLLLGKNSINWRTVNKAYARQASKYYERNHRTGKTFRIDPSIYSIITLSMQHDPEANRTFDYMKLLFMELNESLSHNEKKLIVPALYGILTNIDLKFRNFLGELSVLNLLKRQGYTLLETERPLIESEPNGTKIDFHLKNTKTNQEHLVEIVNIKIDDKNTADDETITKLLNAKIVGKLLETGIKRSNKFILMPVVWGNWEYVLRLLAYFQTNNPTFANTITPAALVPFTTETGELVHIFGTIDTIFVQPGGVKFTS